MKTPLYDYLIVGSGLFGSTFSYFANKSGKRCLVIDKRPYPGGNLYCECIDGIAVHKYGAHIFHTGNQLVWDFVNSIVPFNSFTNSPLADFKGARYNLPFNMNTFCQLWNDVKSVDEAKKKIGEQCQAAINNLNGREPNNLEEQAMCMVGTDIYNILIKEYTEKQWGRPCRELPSFIIKRLPIRFEYNNNYFNDPYQGVPHGGYNELIERLLTGSDIQLSCDFFDKYADSWRSIANSLVYTGPIDQYFNYCYGKLDWRTVTFKTKILNIADFQGNAVINYTSHDVPFTRIIEHKHFDYDNILIKNMNKTIVSEEYSAEFTDGMEPFYPINDEKNSFLFNKYKQLADKEKDVIFGGRLAEYKYYDMAPIIESVISLWEKHE